MRLFEELPGTILKIFLSGDLTNRNTALYYNIVVLLPITTGDSKWAAKEQERSPS